MSEPEGPFFFPVTVPYQGPGRNQSYGTRTSGRMHHGIDFTPPIRIQGSASSFGILAYRGGVVEVAQNGHGYGIIRIRHADGSKARYLHNTSTHVAQDSTVTAGQHIANMGGRGPGGGSVYVPHLHFELLDKEGNSYDPRDSLLDGSNNPLPSLTVVSHATYGPPRSEGSGL